MDVVNSTSSSIVLSECEITVTGFNFSIPNGRVCDNYTFTVTPVNVVGNGTNATLGYSQNFTGMYNTNYLCGESKKLILQLLANVVANKATFSLNL